MRMTLMSLCCGVMALLMSGCAGLSFQQYGSPTRGHTVTEGATRIDVLANLGEPDSVYRTEAGEVFVYKGYNGVSYFGVVAQLERDDTVVVMDMEGNVLMAEQVEVADGWTLFAPAYLDATFPIPSTEILEGPENYDYSYSVEKGGN